MRTVHRSHKDAVLRKWRLILIAGSSCLLAGCGSSPLLSIQVKLDQTTAIAGVSIHGAAVVTNGAQRAITVNACPGDWLNVGLRNGQVSYDPAVAAVECEATVHLQPGITTFPVTVITTYGGCAMVPPFTPSLPRCGATGPPPLPSGKYETTVIESGLPSPVTILPPVDVTLRR